jgi:hypothetical protein
MKKQWQKPELIVLLRTTPEETILEFCRFITPKLGPVSDNKRCQQPYSPEHPEWNCWDRCSPIAFS